MARGVFNPFYKAPPKKDRPSIYDTDPADTEAEIGIIPIRTRLNGSKYAIEFIGIEYEDLNKELLLFMLSVNKKYKDTLQRHGVKVSGPNEIPAVSAEEMTLKDELGYLTVYVGEEKEENAVFNRLGYALTQLPIRDILDKHNVKIVVKG